MNEYLVENTQDKKGHKATCACAEVGRAMAMRLFTRLQWPLGTNALSVDAVCRGIGAVEKPGSGEGCRGAGRGRVRRLQSTSVLRAPRHGRLVPRRPGLHSPPPPKKPGIRRGAGSPKKQVLGEGLPPKKPCVRRGFGSPGGGSSAEGTNKPHVWEGLGPTGDGAWRGPRNPV